MKETDIISVYDTVRIERDSRKARFTSIVKASVFTFLSVAFAIAIVFYGAVLPVFFFVQRLPEWPQWIPGGGHAW